MRRLRRAAPQRATLRELLPLHQTARRRPHLYELRRADPAHRAAGAAAVTTAWSRHFALTRPSAKLPRSSATTGGRHATATGQSTTLDNIPPLRDLDVVATGFGSGHGGGHLRTRWAPTKMAYRATSTAPWTRLTPPRHRNAVATHVLATRNGQSSVRVSGETCTGATRAIRPRLKRTK